jgi:predicted TIM-barrel fold metal-dependent hydrolase
MDIDGVHAGLSFPSFPGFSGAVFHHSNDKELALECVRAWNDFQIDEWCASAPERLIPLGILPTWDPALAATEVERLASIGTKAVSFPDSPASLGLPSFHHKTHWEALWDALEAADMPVCLHFGSGGFVPGFSFGASLKPGDIAPFAVAIATFSTNLMWTTTDLVFSGMLQRHPNLKFLLSEGGIGWIPYILERVDYTWERHRWYQDISRVDRPSDLFRRHIWGCFIDDVHGVASRDTIGIDNILIEVDYPHSDSNWPNSRKRIAETLIEVSDEDTHRIVELNARELLHFGDGAR